MSEIRTSSRGVSIGLRDHAGDQIERVWIESGWQEPAARIAFETFRWGVIAVLGLATLSGKEGARLTWYLAPLFAVGFWLKTRGIADRIGRAVSSHRVLMQCGGQRVWLFDTGDREFAEAARALIDAVRSGTEEGRFILDTERATIRADRT
ncbi:hypothetical protein [Prosthecodimorpha staleyi]|uniref:Uncharacterized protein n=1 Tax=Prosthecodimorpha staleyi TaxID=2840188 RepID=A0A947GBL3_9HYPH|nr:hypothetical protein [Prosthecodimorpha staleyi]MBT9288186.1 hypothetical protein [Prosthecodimorpha staleyi]